MDERKGFMQENTKAGHGSIVASTSDFVAKSQLSILFVKVVGCPIY